MQFDTGSSRFVISTTECAACSGDSPYNRSLSSTFHEGIQPWKIKYGDGSFAEGVVAKDLVTLGSISVQNQTLNMVLAESSNFDDTVDGVLGLSFGSISGSTTVFESMMQQGIVDQGIFSFYFGKRSLNGGGEVIFGGLDMGRIELGNEITYTPVTQATHWNINIQDFTMNDMSLQGEQKTPLHAIVDTGTTLLVGPEAMVRIYHSQIPRSRRFKKTWVVPCMGNINLGIVIEGKTFWVPYKDLAREYVGLGLCFSAVQTSSADFLILGDVFLKNNYVVFDQEGMRVGFAPLKAEEKMVLASDNEEGEGKGEVAAVHLQDEL